mmetsp:Transcript_22267/g.41782  ORF Transcript_22267/g.41782 Transcript_22267/m.41782 type:complete len:84 (+) Transcript_22267:299-550(+)
MAATGGSQSRETTCAAGAAAALRIIGDLVGEAPSVGSGYEEGRTQGIASTPCVMHHHTVRTVGSMWYSSQQAFATYASLVVMW